MAQSRESGDSIRINPKFLKELDKTFFFDQPAEAPIKVPDNVLTREQRREWVGPVEETKTSSISIPGLRGFTDGLQHYGKHLHSVREGGIGCTIDVNALAKYLRPSEIKLRKLRALAEKSKGIMDVLYPKEGPAMSFNADSVALSKR